MSKKKKKCVSCKQTQGLVVSQVSEAGEVLWCARCYTDYLTKTSNKRRVRYVSQPQL